MTVTQLNLLKGTELYTQHKWLSSVTPQKNENKNIYYSCIGISPYSVYSPIFYISYLIHWLSRSMLSNFHAFVHFSIFLLISYQCDWKRHDCNIVGRYDCNLPKFVKICSKGQHMTNPRECSMCDREEHAPWCCWMEHSMSVRSTRSRKWKWKLLSNVRFFVTPWTVAYQAPLSMEFSRPEY